MRWKIFEGLPEDDVRQLLQAAHLRKFKRGDILFHEGDPGETLHLVQKGKVAVRITTPLGHTGTLAVIPAGDAIGELAIFGSDTHRVSSVVALEATETLAVHRDELEHLRRKHPEVATVLIKILIDKIRDLSMQVIEALYVPVDVRTRRRLVRLAEMYGDDDPVEIPLTQEDFATMVGTTRATLNQLLKDEERRGTVSLGRGKITVENRDDLARRAK